MFSKKNRLNSREIEALFQSSRTISSSTFLLKFTISKEDLLYKSAFSVPKKLIKTAVMRNYLKRRGFHALQGIKDQIPAGFKGVFVFKRKELSYQDIRQDLLSLLSKI